MRHESTILEATNGLYILMNESWNKWMNEWMNVLQLVAQFGTDMQTKIEYHTHTHKHKHTQTNK